MNIFIKKTTIYKLSEQIQVSFLKRPMITGTDASVWSYDIKDAFIFEPDSIYLGINFQEITHGVGLYGQHETKMEYVYTDKNNSSIEDEINRRKNNRSCLSGKEVDIIFPKVIKENDEKSLEN